MTIRAIYENGVFKPMEPVSMREHTVVTLHAVPAPSFGEDYSPIWNALGEPVDAGVSDLAERHNEHQP